MELLSTLSRFVGGSVVLLEEEGTCCKLKETRYSTNCLGWEKNGIERSKGLQREGKGGGLSTTFVYSNHMYIVHESMFLITHGESRSTGLIST